MALTIAFDVYGTLIDTQGVLDRLETMMGEKAFAFSQSWRAKQLEYSFRRGLMRQYQTFAVCTQQALDYTCALYDIELSSNDKNTLLELYKVLPAHADVKDGLAALRRQGLNLFAFSNGSRSAVKGLLDHADILGFFDGIVSCEDINSFKPNPEVYDYFLTQADAEMHKTWLVSSNPFDIIGAVANGMKAAWVQRSTKQVFDPWEFKPTNTIRSIAELSQHI
tara:strand:+ start:2576 stop:3241 length:666 start_codon:yes stop_codon:yes gene_type:complete